MTESEALSDEQIEALIQEAEARAHTKHNPVTADNPENFLMLHESHPETSKRQRIPRLEHAIKIGWCH